jgi:hypothetical protein
MSVDTTHRAGFREWVGLAVLALPTLLVSIDVFVMLLALPHLARDWERAAPSSYGSPMATGSCWPAS